MDPTALVGGMPSIRAFMRRCSPPPELVVPNWPPYEGHWPLPART